MLYKKNSAGALDRGLFERPTSEYRGAPFWAWNCKVTEDIVDRQTAILKEMGFGGYHMHSRTGMDVPYLSDEFMALIKRCVEDSKKLGTLAWLYDEDRWASGAAGGLVTKTKRFRQRILRMTTKDIVSTLDDKETAVENGTPYFFHAYDVVLNDKGELERYRLISPDDAAEGKKWFTYCECVAERGWFNNQTYVDTLSKEAIDKFIEITHERYKEVVGGDFGETVPAIFTDEPQFAEKGTFAFANSDMDVILPWTPKLDDKYAERYGERIEDTLPELFWDKPDGEVSRPRYLYHDFVCQLFTESFADNCGDWCGKNGISMTGHMMQEDSLRSQTGALGEAMRSYRRFQLPGIDMLCGSHNYATAKQCQSAVHQYGREGMLSELYGVTDWDFDFRGHKHHGDWQAALGVTVRVPHLSWMSMYGEAKRDYPASIFYQSPWYKEYPYIEDHFARLNTALTRGKPAVDIAVIHPIESYWLHWGPSQNTGSVRAQLENNFQNTTDWLLFAGLDFDFISESLVPELYRDSENGGLKVGEMKYKVVVVPGCETMRASTLKMLEEFRKAGGTVIFMGGEPKYIDAVKSDAAHELFAESTVIGFDRDSLINALEPYRLVGMRDMGGNMTGDMIYNYRHDSDCDWLFICHGREPFDRGASYHTAARIRITVKGIFSPTVWNTLDGKVTPIDYRIENGNTIIDASFYAYDSLLLRLGKGEQSAAGTPVSAVKPVISEVFCRGTVDYRLEEPNALLIDGAEWRVDSDGLTADSDWHPYEETLRLNNAAAREAGLPAYNGAQPWTEPPEILTHHVDLRYTFTSDVEVDGCYLAIENAPLCEVLLNGEKAGDIDGWFVDESIEKIKLPKIRKGENTILIRTPIGIRTKVEWCYLLGAFGVSVAGTEKKITALPEKLGYSSVTSQGLPFYTGNIEYDQKITTPDCDLTVKVSEYRGALIRVFLDGEDKGVIAFDPFTLDLGHVTAGEHTITLRCYGTRYNAFGALHNTDQSERWVGPAIWRTTGDKWCYEYRLRDEGILRAPVLTMREV